jgi:hypothetical protein
MFEAPNPPFRLLESLCQHREAPRQSTRLNRQRARLFGFYFILDNTGKSWINPELFASFFVLPIGLIAFLLIGIGLHVLIKAARE